MPQMTRLTGVTQVRKNMQRFTVDLSVKFSIGLRAGGLYLQRFSQKFYCPVWKGNLKNSAFTRSFGQGFHTDVFVGYTAAYAAFVHEDVDKRHGRKFNEYYSQEIAAADTPAKKRYYHNRGETQQAKFLEKPAREQRPQILAIIAGETKTSFLK